MGKKIGIEFGVLFLLNFPGWFHLPHAAGLAVKHTGSPYRKMV